MRLQINRCNFADTLRCNLILCQYPVHLLRKFFRILVPAAADAENYPLRNQPEYIGLPSTVHRHHNTCDLLLFSSLCRIPKCFFCLKPVKFLRQRSNIHISRLCIKRKRLSGHKHSRCIFCQRPVRDLKSMSDSPYIHCKTPVDIRRCGDHRICLQSLCQKLRPGIRASQMSRQK